MEKFTTLHSTAVPLPIENIDTDQIIPARFLKVTDKIGFGNHLFCDWRFDSNHHPIESFVFNNSNYSGTILVSGNNFGCGSSREHAAWALADYGFKAVISSYFADIFKANALNNGILPIVVSPIFLQNLLIKTQHNPETKIEINLENQTVTYNEQTENFDIDNYKKICLINGYDDIDFLLNSLPEIEQFEKQHRF